MPATSQSQTLTCRRWFGSQEWTQTADTLLEQWGPAHSKAGDAPAQMKPRTAFMPSSSTQSRRSAEHIRRIRASNSALGDVIKLHLGCEKCAKKHRAADLDFHRLIPMPNTTKVSKLYVKSRRQVLEEIGKCQVLCKACYQALQRGRPAPTG